MNKIVILVFQICFLAGLGFANDVDYNPELGCIEDCHVPEGEVLFMADQEHMCPESDLYGRELSKPFVSRLWSIGSDDQAKTWQLRTITVFDERDQPHHLLFPFAINSGGLTAYVGGKTIEILKKYGAKERQDHTKGFASYCRLRLPLPIKNLKCLHQWEPGEYDDGNDIRNNMIGANHAKVIISIDAFVDAVLMERMAKASFLQILVEQYPESVLFDFEQELDLQLKAPISKNFIPPESQIPLLSKEDEL